MTFEEELESLKGKETIEEVSAYKIGLYLKRRAAEDPSVASNIAKANKTLTECYRYVKREIGKMVKNDPIVMMDDGSVYGMAVHYYDEDDIKLAPLKDAKKVVVNAVNQKKITAKSKENPTPAEQQQQTKETVKNTRKKKSDPVEGQISLFEV
ncbi:PcfK-like family protein [[Clostridium] innocuum]|jgi:hypothetical protein|nr:PcfK-like family protein [[Clostridium] innocuum]MCR0487168.1 PcfK-like family protein [[Clostridium] innocuum]